LKNKEWSKLVKQLHFDVRTTEENIQHLANDQVRMEKQFGALWDFVYKHKGELAEKPELQMIKCNFCDNWSKDYKIHIDPNGYFHEAECKQCLINKERENEDFE
jgi:hypothetical protein